jgi:hypothetical protein
MGSGLWAHSVSIQCSCTRNDWLLVLVVYPSDGLCVLLCRRYCIIANFIWDHQENAGSFCAANQRVSLGLPRCFAMLHMHIEEATKAICYSNSP